MTGTWYPPALGTGGVLIEAQLFTNPPFAMTTDIPNRDHQHGGMDAVGEVSQTIKDAIRTGRNWPRLSRGRREALDMLAHKIARVLSGADPHDPQHWEDLAGYPQAAMRDGRGVRFASREEQADG
jgi:hypothetical protein